MPLRNHLRADENIDFPGSKVGEHLLVRALGANRIAVQARHLGSGKFLAQFFLELLRAGAKKIDVLGGALRAGLRHAARKSAVVALQPVALLVIRERDAAILTLNSRAARAADDEPRIPAAIDEDQGLSALTETRGDGFTELRGEGAGSMRGTEIFAQVHNFHRRKRPILDARFELKEAIFSRARVVKTLERRRCGTQQRHGAFELRAHDSDVPAVITRGFFLLVARFLFLVHDNEAQIFKRSEHGRSRSYYDASFAAAHAPPFARAFHFGKRAVKYRNARAKPGAAEPSHPERQGDFRHQYQRRLVARESRLDSSQVHFRLAAAGDTIEQSDLEGARFEPSSDFAQRALLIRIQNVRRRRIIHFEQIFLDRERLLPAF